MRKEDFKLKKFVLLETDCDWVDVVDVREDDNDGLNIRLDVHVDDMVLQFSSLDDLLRHAILKCLENDGQMVRFTEFLLRELNEVLNSSFFGNEDFELDDSYLFHDKDAHKMIPQMIKYVAERMTLEYESKSK